MHRLEKEKPFIFLFLYLFSPSKHTSDISCVAPDPWRKQYPLNPRNPNSRTLNEKWLSLGNTKLELTPLNDHWLIIDDHWWVLKSKKLKCGNISKCQELEVWKQHVGNCHGHIFPDTVSESLHSLFVTYIHHRTYGQPQACFLSLGRVVWKSLHKLIRQSMDIFRL